MEPLINLSSPSFIGQLAAIVTTALPTIVGCLALSIGINLAIDYAQRAAHDREVDHWAYLAGLDDGSEDEESNDDDD